MEYNNDVVNRIVMELEKCGYGYSVNYDDMGYEIYLKDTLEMHFFIRCHRSESSKIIRIHWIIPLNSDLINMKRLRLLEACDITNRSDFIKAKLLDDCVDITYEVTESAWEIAEKIIVDVMYFFYMRIDGRLFDKALNTDEDLYQYYDEQVRDKMKEIRQWHEKWKVQNEV